MSRWRWDYNGAYEGGERLGPNDRVFDSAEDAIADLYRERDHRTATDVRVQEILLANAQRERDKFLAVTTYTIRGQDGSTVSVPSRSVAAYDRDLERMECEFADCDEKAIWRIEPMKADASEHAIICCQNCIGDAMAATSIYVEKHIVTWLAYGRDDAP